MKLPQKPSGKANRPSRGSTSTQPTEPAASPTSKNGTNGTSSLGTQQEPQDETTEPARGKMKRLLCLTPSKTSSAEKSELYNLGFIFSQMTWLDLSCDDPDVRQGAQRGGVELSTQDDKPNAYDGIIYYKRPLLHTREGVKSVELKTFDNLTTFVSEAVKELYRRDILR